MQDGKNSEVLLECYVTDEVEGKTLEDGYKLSTLLYHSKY